MRLVYLNLWCGRAFDPLMDFLKTQARSADVFCFGEVFSSPEARIIENGAHVNLLSELEAALPEFRFFFVAAQDGWAFGSVDFAVSYGQCIAVKRSVDAAGYRERFIVGERNSAQFDDMNGTMPRVIQSVELTEDGKTYAVCTFHGIATWPKTDMPARLEQSRKVREYVDAIGRSRVLCGDFNLRPDTESVRILARGMRNLTEVHRIATTRSRLCPFKEASTEVSDYCFLSPDITVRSFSVPDVAVSDHLPLVLEFS
jgi:endonuclease/exonuclease/phosphatase family metal-dependent hydrolase